MASSIRDIKGRVSATKKTSQITNAMNMVSASKLKGAQKAAVNFQPYMARVEDVINSLASNGEKLSHPLLEENNVNDKVCYVIVTSDKGLAGPFNSNVNKLLLKEYKEGDFVLPLGLKAYNFVKSKHYNTIDQNMINLSDDVPFETVLMLVTKLVKEYLKGTFTKVVFIYNHFVNTLKIEPSLKTILPIENNFEDNGAHANYEFDEPIESILDAVLPLYLENMVYGIILDSKASEHASRMTAMSNATDNAEELIQKLTLAYNRARQAAITLELTDIIGGSNAINGGN